MSGPPTPPADEQPKQGRSLLLRALPLLKPDWPFYLIALLAAPISTLLVVAQPWLLKRAIDDYIVPGDLVGLRQASLWYLVAVVVGFFAEAAYTLFMSYGAMRTIARVRLSVYQHTLRFAHSYFDRVPTGKLLTRATSDVEALGETLTAGAITIFLDVILVLGIVGTMLWLDWRLTLVMLLVAPVLAFVLNRARRVLRRLFTEIRTSLSAVNAYLTERLAGLTVVQLYSDETRTLREFRARVHRYRDATIRTNYWDAFVYALVDGIRSITMAMLIGYAALALAPPERASWIVPVSAGLLAAFIDYIGRLFRPIQEFSSKLAVLQRASAALEKIFGLLDHDERIESGALQLASPRGAVEFRDLRFAYGADAPDVLKGVDLRIEPGQTVAVVGRTGSGKTTLAKLLTRMYQGYRGSITVDGLELAQLDTASVHRAVGMVQQDVQLFPGDVRFNLTLGRPIPDEELLDVCRWMETGDLVERLGGLEGRVNHKASNLSVGEAQLLSFARTMAHDPPLVILDEATASVDTMTEARIQRATDAILARKTVLVIAHRLSTIINADQIAVMDAGRVVEVGTHQELLAAGGVYAGLVAAQLEEHPAH